MREEPPSADDGARPVGPDEAAALLAVCLDAPAIVLAVSGGPDSMAMLALAAQWRAGHAAGPAIHVATVDHGLRSQSRREAEQVRTWAGELGLPHAILEWTGDKPGGGIQEKAREARYALLAAHAVAVGARDVLTAHHADDQAETVLMRLLRGSGPAGLAGMRASRRLGPVTLRRPFLGIGKARLVATLRQAGRDWIEDPSNTDERYGRAAARRILKEAGLSASRLATLAIRQQRTEDALEAAVTQAAARHLARNEGGIVRLAGDAFDAPAEIVLRLLARGIDEAAGLAVDGIGSPPLPLERLERMGVALAEGARNGRPLTRTAGGCVLRLRHGEVTIVREKERRRGRLPRSRPEKVGPVGSGS